MKVQHKLLLECSTQMNPWKEKEEEKRKGWRKNVQYKWRKWAEITIKSTTYGAAIVPMWAEHEADPIAVFLTSVGNNSAVCKMTTMNADAIQKRPKSEIIIMVRDSSVWERKEEKVNFMSDMHRI